MVLKIYSNISFRKAMSMTSVASPRAWLVVPEKAFNRLIYLFLFREFIGHNQQHKVINFSKAGE